MALELNLSLTSSLSLQVTAHNGFFGVFCGKRERGFALERQHGPNPSGKWLEAWRNPACGTLNVSAPGVLLMIYGGTRPVAPTAA